MTINVFHMDTENPTKVVCEGGYLRISLRGGVIFYFLGQVREPAGKLLKIEYVVDQR